MSDLETTFRHLEIFPGAKYPLTYDARDTIVAAAVRGWDLRLVNLAVRVQEVIDDLVEAGLFTYLADLLGMPADAKRLQIAAALTRARAEHFGLPADTPLDAVLAAERQYNRCLTIGELRRERDKRNGTYVPLVNGEW